MTNRERTLRIFRRDSVDNIVYQPRIEHWYNYNRARGTLPGRYAKMELLEVYDDLNCSIRPYHYFNDCLKFQDSDDVRTEATERDGVHTIITSTPVGAITMRIRTTALANHIDEFPIKSARDVDVMEYALRTRKVWFDTALYEERNRMVGDRCAPMMYLPRVNMQRIILDYVGWQESIYMLTDDRPLLERLVRLINETDEAILSAVISSPIPIVNFGDNVDQFLLAPPLFQEFVLPVYQDRGRRFRAAGKFTDTHFDGNVSQLLKFSHDCLLDGFEALTPVPQGDLTIEQMKEALGDDLILLDGIPMTSFLPDSDYDEFERMTRRIIETFSPNLILGISDEPSPVCDIERVRRAGRILEEYGR